MVIFSKSMPVALIHSCIWRLYDKIELKTPQKYFFQFSPVCSGVNVTSETLTIIALLYARDMTPRTLDVITLFKRCDTLNTEHQIPVEHFFTKLPAVASVSWGNWCWAELGDALGFSVFRLGQSEELLFWSRCLLCQVVHTECVCVRIFRSVWGRSGAD